jgi:mycothiol synthase
VSALGFNHVSSSPTSLVLVETETTIATTLTNSSTSIVGRVGVQVEGLSAEIVIFPAHGGKGIGDQLIALVKESSGKKLRLWSHGELSGAKNLAEKNDLTHSHTVIQIRRSLTDPIPEINSKTPTISLLSGIENENWLKVNSTAFQGRPRVAVSSNTNS